MNVETKPNTKFCWHCARQLRGNFYSEYNAQDGNTYIVHKDCKGILQGDFFDYKQTVDGTEICVGCGYMEDWCECNLESY